MKLELDRTQAQAVAAALQEWMEYTNPNHKWLKTINDIAAKIVYAILRDIP